MDILKKIGITKEQEAPTEKIEEIETPKLEANQSQSEQHSSEDLKAPSIEIEDEPLNPDIDGSHILGLIGGDPLEDGEDEEAPLAGHNKNLSKEEWCKFLAAAIQMGGSMSSFDTLKAVDYANPAASEGLGAMYDTIEDIPSLHWLLKPFGKWAMRIVAISAFIVPLVKGCAGEIKQKRAVKAQGQKVNPATQEQEYAFEVPVINMNCSQT